MLAEKMERWAALQQAADKLAEEIKAEVMELGATQKHAGVTVTYSKGRGAYDYETMAMALEPDDQIIQANTKTTVNWRKVCEAAEGYEEVRGYFYTPGAPYVSIKLK